MDNRLNEYLNLKSQFKELKKQPVGNRVKKGGLLENKIKKVFSEQRAEEILTRTSDYNFESYEALKKRFYNLKKSLEEEGLINEEGEITVKTN